MQEKQRNRGAARTTRGRPRKSEGVRRSRRIVSFFTEAEYARLQQLAEACDRSVSFIVHRMIAEQLRDYEPD